MARKKLISDLFNLAVELKAINGIDGAKMSPGRTNVIIIANEWHWPFQEKGSSICFSHGSLFALWDHSYLNFSGRYIPNLY